MLAQGLKRVRYKLQQRRGERLCRAQGDPLAGSTGLIVTTFYDVEGNYAMPGTTPVSIETVGRILEIEKRCGIRSTYNVVARYALDAPWLIRAIRAAGHEVASHSYDHTVLTTLDRDAIAANLRDTKGVFAELGIDIAGHRCPQSDWDTRVLDALVASGYAWSAENGVEPHPYRLREGGTRALWRFPVADDDWCYEAEGLPPAAVLERWRRQVVAAEGRRTHIAIGFHPWVEAGPGRLDALAEFLEWLAARDGVRVLPFGEVVDLIERIESQARAVGHE